MKSNLLNLLAASASATPTSAIATTPLLRHLQDSLTCLLTAPDPAACCPDPPTDDVCSLLTCVDFDTVALDDECSCSAITEFCASNGAFLSVVAPQVGELCRAADGCCLETDGGGVTENADFNACFEESAVGIEGLAGLVGGGGGEEETVVAADSDDAAADNSFNDDETSETTTTAATPDSNSESSETAVENEAEDAAELNDGDETVPATAPATDADNSSGAMQYPVYITAVAALSIALYLK